MLRYLDAVGNSTCFRSSETPSDAVQVISMSLYGSARRYVMGAVRNAQLAPVVFPGWKLRFYCESRKPRSDFGVTSQRLLTLTLLLLNYGSSRLKITWNIYCRRDADIVMCVCMGHFRTYLLGNWTDFDETGRRMGNGGTKEENIGKEIVNLLWAGVVPYSCV